MHVGQPIRHNSEHNGSCISNAQKLTTCSYSPQLAADLASVLGAADVIPEPGKRSSAQLWRSFLWLLRRLSCRTLSER